MPSLERWDDLYLLGESAGLSPDAAWGYATLAWWGEHFGIRAPAITSGRRSAARQRELRGRWDRGDRRGLVARPAEHSHHTSGNAFDISAPPEVLRIFGSWAPLLGLRWGGTFRSPDPVHFDTGGGL